MRTIRAPFARLFRSACYGLAFLGMLALILLAPTVSAQSGPDPKNPARPPGHDHSLSNGTVQSGPASSSGFRPQAAGNTVLLGSSEVPGPGDPDGTGTAQVQVDVGASRVCVTIGVANLSTPTLAHIHRGIAGVAGPIMITLPTPVNGSSSGCVTANPLLLQEILLDPAGFYVNVHTTEFPAGAIRGQVVLTPPTRLFAAMTGAAQIPPADPDGGGFADVILDLDTSTVCATLGVGNIQPATLAHIHQGDASTNGPIVLNLPVPSADSATGCTTGVNPSTLQAISSNPSGFYVNVHNAEFPNGAIRGQLEVARPISMLASLTGVEVVPGPGDPDGIGLIALTADVPSQSLCANISLQGIADATALHLHKAPFGTATADIALDIPLPPGGVNFRCGSGLNPVFISDLVSDPSSYYVDVHNADFVDGALRGQLHALAGPAVAATADVELVSKVDSPDPATVGQPLTYTITARNNGPDLATNVVVTDTLPAGLTFVSATPNPACVNSSGTVTCTFGALANGATATVNIVVTPTAAGAVVNTASVSIGIPDTNLNNNSAQASTTVQVAPINCLPRPPVRVQTEVVTVGGVARLRATVVAQTSTATPTNAFSSIQFTRLDGARVTFLPNGPNNQTAPFSQTLPAGTTQVQFDVFRVTPGAAATVQFTANDSCGAWPSFVGAGPGVGI